MAKKTADPETKLKALADLLHRGWEKRYPPTEQESNAIRQVVKEQWMRKQESKHAKLKKVAASLSSVALEVAPGRPMIESVEEPKELPMDQQSKPPPGAFSKPKVRKKIPAKVAKKHGNAKLSH